MTVAQPDAEDDSDRERTARAIAGRRRALVDALCDIPMRAGSHDRSLVVELRAADLAEITPRLCAGLGRLAWKYRRELPQHLRPKLPPFDPIVREMEGAGV